MTASAPRIAREGGLSPLKLSRLGGIGNWLPVFSYQLTLLDMKFETSQYFLEGRLQDETQHKYIQDFPKESPFGRISHFNVDFGTMGIDFLDPHACTYIEEWRVDFLDVSGKELSFVVPRSNCFDSRTTAIEVTATCCAETSISFAELINILDVGMEHLDIAEVTQYGPDLR